MTPEALVRSPRPQEIKPCPADLIWSAHTKKYKNLRRQVVEQWFQSKDHSSLFVLPLERPRLMSHYGPSPPSGPSQHPSAYPHPTQRYYDPSRVPVNEFSPNVTTGRCAPVGHMRVRSSKYLFAILTLTCSFPHVKQQGEQVEVRIRGNVWIVGLLVSSLHLISSVSTSRLDVALDTTFRDVAVSRPRL